MSTVYQHVGDADGLDLPEGAIAIAVNADGPSGRENPLTVSDLDAAIEFQAAERNARVVWRAQESYTRELPETFQGKLLSRYQRYTYVVLEADPERVPA